MTKQISINCGVILTILRPSGETERVEFTKFASLAPSTLAAIRKATKAAGKGDVLAWEQMTRLVDAPQPTAADIAEQRAYEARRAVERTSANGRA